MAKSKMTGTAKGIPSSLRILGKTFSVRCLKKDEEVEVDGLMELGKQRISIRPSPNKECTQDTSLHEVVHAVADSLGLEMTESQVHGLAAGLLSVFKDNPKYAKWLTK